MVRFESTLERDCIAFLAGHDGFRRIESQPISIAFAYGGQERRYTPGRTMPHAQLIRSAAERISEAVPAR
jgi:hypothetical protein